MTYRFPPTAGVADTRNETMTTLVFRETGRVRQGSGRGYGRGMEILYISSSGPSDPTRASLPWHLAVNGSIESGQTARIMLLGDAAAIVRADVRDGVEGVGLPGLRDLAAKAVERSVPVHV